MRVRVFARSCTHVFFKYMYALYLCVLYIYTHVYVCVYSIYIEIYACVRVWFSRVFFSKLRGAFNKFPDFFCTGI